MNTRKQAPKSSKKRPSRATKAALLLTDVLSTDVLSTDDDGKELDVITPAALQMEGNEGDSLTAKPEPKLKRNHKRPHSSKLSDPESIHFKYHKLPVENSDAKKVENSASEKSKTASQEYLASDTDYDSDMKSICDAHGLSDTVRSPTPMQKKFSTDDDDDDDDSVLKVALDRISRDKRQAE
jgi:hypothetical protein